MTLPAGKYDRKARFVRVTEVQDALGTMVASEATLVSAWAMMRYGTAAERRTGAGEEATGAATLRVRSTAALRGVTTRDRVEVDGQIWAIQGIARVAVQGSDIEFTLTAWRDVSA